MLDLNAVDEGFSRKAEVYDAYCESHPVIRWSRGVVRRDVINCLTTGDSILELNAGTGSDAAYFVQQGYRVHATDIASGMVSAIQSKINVLNEHDRFTVQQLSFTELDRVIDVPYDMAFSNFGGLNCVSDLQAVTRSFSRLLKPGGYIVWVVMPPICPWELAQALRGHFKVATRRLDRKGVMANVEGAQIMTWYHAHQKVVEAFAPEFHLVKKRSLSLFCPPSYMDGFPHRYPRLTDFLLKLDGKLGALFPFRHWGDFVIYTFRYL